MRYMNARQRGKCHAIIHAASASAGAVGAGLAQVPCSDNAVIAQIQTSMTIALGRVFGLELTDSAARAALAGAAVGRTASQVLIGWLPGVGYIASTSTAASATETLGWRLAKDFARKQADRPGRSNQGGGSVFMPILSALATCVSLGATLGGAIATIAGASVATGTAVGTVAGAGAGVLFGVVKAVRKNKQS